MIGSPNRISVAEALKEVHASDSVFKVLFERGDLQLEIYQPIGKDKQSPHDRDEIYIIASGSATFDLEGQQSKVAVGVFLFVPAQAEHRFVQFSDDFSTWVIFFGKEVQEKLV